MNLTNQNINSNDIACSKIGFRTNAYPMTVLPQAPEKHPEPYVELPDMYYMPENYKTPKTFKDKIKKIDLFNLITPWFEHPLLMIGTCAGLSLGVDAFDKSCNKEYEKSIVGKAAKFGDKIEQSNVVQNDTSQQILSGMKAGWKKFKTAAMKNDVINSMVTTPSKPEFRAPKEELKNTNYRLVAKFKELASAFELVPGAESTDGVQRKTFKIKDLALSKSEINNLKQLYKTDKLSKIPEEEIVNRVMLQRLGKTETEIAEILSRSNVSDLVAKELFKKSGLTSAELEAIFKDDTGETIELVKKASKNLRGVKLAHGKIILPGPRQPFANIEGFEGVYNRIHSLTEGAQTKTGRFMSKLIQKIYRGFTFGNQKQTVLLWVAPFLAGSIVNTIKADRDEKLGTAVSGLVNSFSWVFTFPLALSAIYAFGGIQNAGMGKEKVEEYNNKKLEFNKRVQDREFKSWGEYWHAKRALKKELKAMRQVKNQNLLTETLRGISRFSKADLLKLESYQNSSTAGNFIRKLPNLIKDYLIYSPGRFLIFMFAGIGLVDKVIDKFIAAIFGKPYDGMKDDMMKDSKQKQEEFTINDLRMRMLDIQRGKLYPVVEKADSDNTEINSSSELSYSMARFAELAERDGANVEQVIAEDVAKVEQTEPETIEKEVSKTATDEILSENGQEEVILEDNTEIPDAESRNRELVSENENVSAEKNVQNADNYTYIPSSENIINDSLSMEDPYKYIPSSENIINGLSPAQQIYKYIPGQNGIKVNKVFDNSALESAIRRSELAEKRAINTLAGNFGNL